VKKSIHSPKQQILLDLLVKIRKDSGLTQVEMAKLLDRPQSFVSKYESGERRLDLVELHQICKALEFSLSRLVEEFESIISTN